MSIKISSKINFSSKKETIAKKKVVADFSASLVRPLSSILFLLLHFSLIQIFFYAQKKSLNMRNIYVCANKVEFILYAWVNLKNKKCFYSSLSCVRRIVSYIWARNIILVLFSPPSFPYFLFLSNRIFFVAIMS